MCTSGEVGSHSETSDRTKKSDVSCQNDRHCPTSSGKLTDESLLLIAQVQVIGGSRRIFQIVKEISDQAVSKALFIDLILANIAINTSF